MVASALFGAVLLAFALLAEAQDKRVDTAGQGRFHAEVPAYEVNTVLGRPTDRSVVANVFAQRAMNIEIRFGTTGKMTSRTESRSLGAGTTHEFLLADLPANSEIDYQLFDTDSGRPIESRNASGTFHTARPPGEAFLFTVQADSHLDGDTIPSLYGQTLQNIAAAGPDFHIDLGDTFMTDMIADSTAAEQQYLAQRYWLGQLCHEVPLLMVLGNHDGISGPSPRKKNHVSLNAWTAQKRARYFSNPPVGGFYDANPAAGLYHYAWHWGDALFVVLDPYSHSAPARSGEAPWNMTLGRSQYEWLSGVLRGSQARFKFVFIHQLVGGLGKGGRGGLEAASLFEWGGHDGTGEWQFEAHRTGWEQPVHQLLSETGVSAVFHGHDHFYAHQLLDEIHYVLVPQPAHRNARKHHAQEYGYEAGTFIPNSGHVQVEVNAGRARVSYVRSANEELRKATFSNGERAHTFDIRANKTPER